MRLQPRLGVLSVRTPAPASGRDGPAPARGREEQLAALAGEELDLLIIGGGVTGAALAYLAAQGPTPLRVALVEAGDLASGTSSRSSRLLHGGLRYLAQGRVPLVRRMLQGRRELGRLAPHLVRAAPFLLPLGGPSPYAPWLLRASLRAYACLEGGGARHRQQSYGAAELLRREPLLSGGGVRGALVYEELATHDARLVVELAGGAAAAGAIVLPRVRCEELRRQGDRVSGARVSDVLTGRTLQVRARAVVNATGAWCDRLGARAGERATVRLSRGTHLVIAAPRLPLAHTVVFFSPRDGRALFASPRDGYVLVGTTEVEHRGPPDDVTPSRAEVRYLLDATAAAFPAAGLQPDDVATAFAGVRALADGSGADTGSLDRGYVVRWDAPGLLSLRGGKLTLALAGARRALAALHARRRQLGLPAIVSARPGELPPLPGADADSVLAARASLAALGLPQPIRQHLLSTYGGGAALIAELVRARPESARPLRPGLPHLEAEWLYAQRFEHAVSWNDFARRRGDLALHALVGGSPPGDRRTVPPTSTTHLIGRAA